MRDESGPRSGARPGVPSFLLSASLVLSVLLWSPAGPSAAEARKGYHPKVAVSAPGRLDWTFVVANRSLAEPPADWTPGYDAAAQRYELFVPEDYDPGRGHALVLFIPAESGPAGWREWGPVCRKSGAFFASPFDAGNECPMRRRVRIVLDVLDDLRRAYRIDPDRVYVGGISGGGRAACAVAFALPELFGGAVPVCASGELREERWLRHRVMERLSVAMITGETDFNRGEVERLRGPMFAAVGVRSRVWVAPGTGHAVPKDGTLAEAFQWLEEGLDARRMLAEKHQAMRIAAGEAPDARQWSDALLAEARARLTDREAAFSGLMQLKGLAARWPEEPAAAQAREVLRRYSGAEDRPWSKSDLDEQRRFRVAEARALSDYVTGPLEGPYAGKRPEWARAALARWRDILGRNPGAALRKEAEGRIRELEELAHAPD